MSSLPPLHVAVHEPSGESTGPGVLMIHGYVSSGVADFGVLAKRLSALGRRCAVVDLPAHGESPEPLASADASIDGVLAALADATEVFGGAAFDVVGYSLGARLAWELASRGPGQVCRVVLGGFGPADPFSMVDARELWALVDHGAEPMDQVTAILGGMAVAQGERAAGIARLVEGLGAEQFVPSPDYSPACPVLLLCGRDDDLATGSEQIAGMLAHVELAMIEGDHGTALRGPEFANRVIEFLS